MDWLDAIPVEILPQPDQDNEQNIPVLPIRCETNLSEIPQLESDIDEEEEGQFEDLQTYLTHHNTYQESQNIHKEYRKRLLDLNDERYYRDIDCAYETYSSPQGHIPVNQVPRPCRTMQELIQTFWSPYTISTEQNSKKDQENSMHVTEIYEYPIKFFFYNNLICI